MCRVERWLWRMFFSRAEAADTEHPVEISIILLLIVK